LTPKKVSVFLKNEDIVNIRVVSEAFAGMTFSARFKLLNQMLKDQQPDIFNKYIYVFEAFTTAEVAQLPKSDGGDRDDNLEGLKHSAQPLEP
jgi:hypothetical protein